MDTKKCSTCGLEKKLTSFHKNLQVISGRSARCKECSKIACRKYYHNNLDKVHAYRKREYKKYRIKFLEKAKIWKQKTLDSWKDYLPNIVNCQICGKKLVFGSTNKKESIHFDHRNGGEEIIKITPSHWLRRTPRTPKTTEIWDSCNFGFLCEQCNMRLPTKNRKEFIKQAVKYVFGKTLDL